MACLFLVEGSSRLILKDELFEVTLLMHPLDTRLAFYGAR